MTSRSRSRRGRGKPRDGGGGWEQWGGYMEAKKQKLQDQFALEKPTVTSEQGDNSHLFEGVAISVNGYTIPTSDELKKLMMRYGGKYQHYYSRDRTTHIIATNLPNSKIANITDKKVVHPDWIVNSIKAGKLLPYQDYQLYSAKSTIQPALQFKPSVSPASSSASKPVEDVSSDAVTVIPASDEEDEEEVNQESTHHALQPGTDIQTGASEQDEAAHSAKKTANQVRFRSPAKLAGDAGFVSEFYSNSRLHHLSTWGAEFKAYVSKLQTQGDTTFPGRKKLMEISGSGTEASSLGGLSGMQQRVVMHVDMDCFFVSVGLRNRPDLKGKPVAVTHSRGKGVTKDRRPGADPAFEKSYYENRRKERVVKTGGARRHLDLDEGIADLADEAENSESDETGGATMESEPATVAPSSETFHSFAEIASCSYEARNAGVKNGMFMGKARQLCPQLQTIPYDFEGYNKVSRCLYDTVASYTHDIEAVSCDEMLVDCTDLLAATGATPLQFAALLRDEIREKTQCTASAGLASNILLAKLATRKAKPNGQFHLQTDDVEEFIKDISISSLPGVGWSLTSKLQSLGVSTCGDLQKLPLPVLQKDFGPKTGQMLFNYSRGQDSRPIRAERERKSVSAEINYGIRFTKDHEVEKFLAELSEEVCNRLRRIDMKARTLTLKLMFRKKGAPKETAKFMGHGVCDHIAKSTTLPLGTDEAKSIHRECCTILRAQNIPASDMRGMGIQLSRLEAPPDKGTSRGLQSILNFTRKPKGASSTDTAQPQVTAQSTGQDGAPSGGVLQDEAEVMESPSSPVKKALPPLPTLPDFTSPISQPSQSPPDTLVTHSRLHPQAPVGMETSPFTMATGDRVAMVTPNRNTVEDLYVPSPSQLDPEVLRHLPPDIQRQIQRVLDKKKMAAPPVAMATRSRNAEAGPRVEAHPGCSHWSQTRGVSHGASAVSPSLDVEELTGFVNEESALPGGSHDNHDDDAVVSLPNYSQLDPSCMKALPDDMRAELELAYKARRKEAHQAARNHPLMMAQTRVSPVKSKSPQKKRSPRKRGRPAGSKSRKLNVSPRKTMPVNPQPRPVVAEKQLSADQAQQPSTSHINPESSTTRVPPGAESAQPAVKATNLCGAVTLAEVKSLLKDWIASCSVPESEDVHRVVLYLSQLIQDRNLEKVDLLLKCIHRQVSKSSSAAWSEELSQMVQEVQAIVRSLYGGVLKLWTH